MHTIIRPSAGFRFRVRGLRAAAIIGALMLAAPAVVGAKHFTAWGPAAPEVGINSPQADGCPIESPNGLELYIASRRDGAVGGAPDLNDIWVARRASVDAPWQEPEHLPEPINSAAADFCPTPLNGNGLLFVSTRGGGCGAGDMYFSRNNPNHGWSQPVNLGCQATGSGPNFAGGEFSPSLVETAEGTLLYFSSSGPTTTGDQNIYVSRMRPDGSFEPATAVGELNTGSHDQMPNISRDGLEIVFSSDRDSAPGVMDIYTASRSSTAEPFGPVVTVGPNVNTVEGSETRASLSGDGERLHFGRGGEIYVSHRSKVSGAD